MSERAGAATETLLVVGDVVTDIVAVHTGPLAVGSDTAATIRVGGGGSAANTAAWLASLGVPATLVGVVGDDEQGDLRLAELRAAGVHCAVRRAEGAVTGSIVVLSAGGERTMLSDRGANALLVPNDIDTALATTAPGGAHLHLSGYVLFDPACEPAGRHALTAAAGRQLTTSVDAASAAPLERLGPAAFLAAIGGVDLLFANLDEARVLAGRAGPAAELATALLPYASGVVVKCGADGAIYAGRDARSPVSSPAASPDRMLDPTGAGDAFAAGFLAARLRGAAPNEALTAGARLGARAVARLGGRP